MIPKDVSCKASYEDASLLVDSYWSDFRKWKSDQCNSHLYDEIFTHLDEIAHNLIHKKRKERSSIRYQVSKIEEEDEVARTYRHLRDFGSLKHFNSQRDIQLTAAFKLVLKQLKQKKENQLQSLFSSKGNLIADFLESRDSYVKAQYKELVSVLAIGGEKFLTRTDYREALSFLRLNIQSTLNRIPWESLEDGGFSKIIRIMIGVVMYSYYSLPNTLSRINRSKILLQALKIGYYFGASYPLIDNIFDSKTTLLDNQKIEFSKILSDALSGIDVSSKIPQVPFIEELYRCCLGLNKILKANGDATSLKYISIAHQAQVEHSRISVSSNYTEDYIYTRCILKAAFIRISTASISGYEIDKGYIHDSIAMGLNNQLSDDFEDFPEDCSTEVSTPFSLFAEGRIKLNPLLVTFDHYIFSARFHSNFSSYLRVCSLRFAETVREFVRRNGTLKYKEFIDTLTENEDLIKRRSTLYKLAELSQYSIHLHQETLSLEKLDFFAKEYLVGQQRESKNSNLFKLKSEAIPWIEKTVLTGNLNEFERYALSGFCQRSRPLLCFLVANAYELDVERIKGLVRAVEYFHSASLILDDLPSQDNASLRRGQPTLHKKYGESTAQITAVSLIARGYYELGNIEALDSIKIEIVQYASQICSSNGLCSGQMKDIEKTHANTTSLSELLEIAYLKTGIAIEFCCLSVSTIVQDSSDNRAKLKAFARHIGIAYQIKDDLNDSKESSNTGKDRLLDLQNNKKSFLYLLGYDEAKRLLLQHKTMALNILVDMSLSTEILREFVELLFVFC